MLYVKRNANLKCDLKYTDKKTFIVCFNHKYFTSFECVIKYR